MSGFDGKLPPALLTLAAIALLAGCGPAGIPASRPEAVWGRRGISPGRLQKPRAIAIDARQQLYIVDMTARIQVFDLEGHLLRGWETPEHQAGRPTGLSIGRDGDILVADTHYHRLLIYRPDGLLLRTIGGVAGNRPGQFGLVTHAVQDREGNYYIGEYGEFDRIQKFSPEGHFLLQWGGHGAEPGQFARPQRLAFDRHQRLWVADACNHRIQVFDRRGKLLFYWGSQGAAAGQLYYPYDLAIAADESLYVCEFGNDRVQRFTPAGRSLGCWGACGREEGQLNNPWALVLDRQGRVFVLDSNNHRVQRFRL
jgi:sugar lactone lactonase YvrE